MSPMTALSWVLPHRLLSAIARSAAYSTRPWLKQALIDTVDQGIITGDLRGKTTNPEAETVVDMYGFLDAVERNLDG